MFQAFIPVVKQIFSFLNIIGMMVLPVEQSIQQNEFYLKAQTLETFRVVDQ
jgi:hypothetical protein